MEHSQDVTKITLSPLNLSENDVSVSNYIESYRIVSNLIGLNRIASGSRAGPAAGPGAVAAQARAQLSV